MNLKIKSVSTLLNSLQNKYDSFVYQILFQNIKCKLKLFSPSEFYIHLYWQFFMHFSDHHELFDNRFMKILIGATIVMNK